MEFFKIDGSHGEGGGQILRSAITLSCIMKTPIKIENIRHNRKNPGLSAQHLSAVKILSKICNAKVSGLEIGSKQIEFIPNDVENLSMIEDVGTAGSIPLILQVLIYAVSLSKKSLEISIKGGTDVLWSPTMDYTRFVLSEALANFGIKYSIKIKKRGYYPKGGGIVNIKISPCNKINPILLTSKNTNDVNLFCTYSKIKQEKIQSELVSIEQNFKKDSLNVMNTKITNEEALDKGASILAYRNDKNSILGMSSLWNTSAEKFVDGISSKKFIPDNLGVDENLADMLVIPASQSKETSIFRVASITKHLETNLYVTSKLTGCKYGIGKISGGYEVRIKGEL